MNSVTLENFRCFGERRTVRLAPLTLLVGENSTGKTSFLAAVRALADVAYGRDARYFREPPYDLGSFNEIRHIGGTGADIEGRFFTGFEAKSDSGGNVCYGFEFGDFHSSPIPVKSSFEADGCRIVVSSDPDQPPTVDVVTSRGMWRCELGWEPNFEAAREHDARMWWLARIFAERSRFVLGAPEPKASIRPIVELARSPPIDNSDVSAVERLANESLTGTRFQPMASSPVRSQPHRVYEYGLPLPGPEGSHVPYYLAGVYRNNNEEWPLVIERLRRFGRESGLFRDLKVRFVGPERELFRLMVQIPDDSVGKSEWRNIADVGYGVSQVLPIVVDLYFLQANGTALFQQPEIHLHPSAQAALGSHLCQVASSDRKILVETHSDYLLDRVRLDVRDRKFDLRPEDVAILYFERRDADVDIHEIRIDDDGDLVGQPDGYREFFRREFRRVFLPGEVETAD